MKLALFLPVMLLGGCGGASDQSTVPARALVSVVRVERGTAPEWLTVYGSATPSQTGAQTLSINQPGQVSRLLVTTGAAVRAGQPILAFMLAPSSQAAYAQARAQFQLARAQRDTTQRLLGQQLATRDQMAQAEKAVGDAQATLDALAKDGAGGALTLVRAPFAGVVTAIPVAQGDRTQPGAALATVARAGGIVVTVGAPPEQASHIHTGQRARIHPLDGSTMIDGQVVRVDNALDPQTKLVDVDISFPAGAMMSGAGAQVDIATATRNGWAVPHHAVVTALDEPHVFQIAGSKAKSVPVTIAVPGRDTDLVEGELDPARPLIVEGAYQVADGDLVRVGVAR
ncbi:MAG TPA: efflux RND transporter periplasmic adaptor subunit [Sphingomonas sp.]|nr:efflux RND transporter periplasmic adaptor subunit [Sphingomonas sp.]